MRALVLTLVCALLCVGVAVTPRKVAASGTPVSLTALDTAYQQDFNTLATSGTTDVLPTGWALAETGTAANTTYTANDGALNTGNTYSYGTGTNTDRAFGMLQSGSLVPTIGACFTNNTGSTISSLDVAYTGEEWRLGTTARADRIDFQYSTDATSLTTGTWTDVNLLDYSTTDFTTGTAGMRDGNNAMFRTAVSSTISGLTIATGATFFIRWTDFNASGADDGLAVDDFSLTPHGSGPGTPTLSLSITPSIFSEGAGTNVATGTVTRANDPGANASPLVVTLTNPDSTEVSVPATVTILATQTMATFQVDAVDDGAVDGTQSVTITASAGGFTSGMTTVQVTDNDVQIDLISAVQGDVSVLASPANLSPKATMSVTIQGVVTNVAGNGFWVQEEKADDDGNANTSEGIFVFTSSSPTAQLGQIVRVSGVVSEFTPGGVSSGNLPTTEITGPSISVQGTIPDAGAPGIDIADLRAAVNIKLLDNLPDMVIYNPASPNDPNSGTEFWESIEGMLAEVTSGVVVAPTTVNGEFTVVAPGDAALGSGYFPTTHNLIIQPNDPPYTNPANPPTIGGGDFNPERIIVDDKGNTSLVPQVAADGDVVNNIVGTVDYSFGNPKLEPVFAITSVTQGSQSDPLVPQGDQLRVVSFNMENLFDTVNEPGRNDDPILSTAQLNTKITKLRLAITGPLALPDIIVCPEIENQPVLQQLAAAVNTATGTTNYVARSLDAADDRSIEVGFIYNSNRVQLQSPFTPASLLTPPGNPSSGTTVGDDNHTRSASVGPFADINLGTSFLADTDEVFEGGTGAAFSDSREPLVGVFRFNGADIAVVGVHLASKGGDGPLYGVNQPVVRGSEDQRELQGQYVRELVDLLFNGDAPRNIPAFDKILVCGDFNDFQFPEQGEVGSDAVSIIQGLGVPANRFLHNLVNDVPAEERYTFMFDGNSQTLDHMLVSPALLAARTAQDIAHINADYPGALDGDDTTFNRSSDHEAVAGTFQFVACASGKDTVGLFSGGSFFLRNCNTPGPADVAVGYGLSSWVPVRGDYDGDGDETIGAFDGSSGCFFLRNTNTPGPADTVVCFGAAGDVPLVGDWDGNGTATIGVYRPTTQQFFLKNSNTSGAPDISFTFGGGGATPIVGDWNGDGTTTIGIYVSATGAFFLKNTNAGGTADLTFTFGGGGGVPVVGDWDSAGGDSIGLYVSATGAFFLKNSNAAGAADIVLTFGAGGATPLAGNWDGL